MTIPFYIIDVFTNTKYAGNQLAVFMNAEALSTTEMQQIATEINFAESTFVTSIDEKKNTVAIKIFTPAHEMKFAGHPIIGTSWVLLNKVFEKNANTLELQVPIGGIKVKRENDLIWLKAAQPEFFDVLKKEEFAKFSTLSISDFDERFKIQEVTTGSAFIIVPVKNKSVLSSLKIDKENTVKWLEDNCKTAHKALYFFCLEGEQLTSRMFCIENDQVIEDAATGSASTCLQAYLLKYHNNSIALINNQGEFINRSSQIHFDGRLENEVYDINIGGVTKYVAQGEWEV
jgi:trans-2,3-dihydro-3-hydroxyanthranilate isomerase